MALDPANSLLSTPDLSTEMSESSSSKRTRRATVRVACNVCRNKKTRCDGRRPICGWCASHPGVRCSYDTGSAEETRSAALKRENDVLKRQLERAERILQDLICSSDEQSMEILRRLRVTESSAWGPCITSPYDYTDRSNSAENHTHTKALPSLQSITDMVVEPRSHSDHTAATTMHRPSPNKFRSIPSPEFAYVTNGFAPVTNRSPTSPIHPSGGVQSAARGSP